MNDLVRIAQVTSGASAPLKVKIVKPTDGAALVIQVAPGMVLDLQGVAMQDVVMVQAGDRLIVLFADRSSVVLAGLYGPDGQPIAGLDVDLGRGEPIPAGQLAGLLPISNDMNLLPAAGPASPSGNAPGSSLHLTSVTPDDLGDGGQPLDLLSGNDTGAGGGLDGFSTVAAQGRVNNAAVMGGQSTGAVTEDLILSATGVLTVADPDAGEAQVVAQTQTVGLYGTFSVTADGTWVYVLDNGNSAVQALGSGKLLAESFTVSSIDGTANQILTVTINGTNDVPVIGGTFDGAVTEDVTFGTAGTLTIADVDTGESSFIARLNIAGLYGTFAVDAAGHWTYALDNTLSAVQSLGAGHSITDSFVVTSMDGSADRTVIVTIHGTNDVPVIGGTSVGIVKEDNTLSANGILTIADIDTGESNFAAQPGTVGLYGTFSIDAAGSWTYTLRNSDPAVQSLGANSHPTETFMVWSSDGSASQIVTITVNGTNDRPTLAGVTNGYVDEDGRLSAGANLQITDRDTGEAFYEVQTDTAGTYGKFSIDAAGHWTYALNNDSAAVQSLGAGSRPTETFKVWSADHSASLDITVTVNGANDVPTVGGMIASAVTEDGTTTANGNLTISDPDSNQSSFIARSNAGAYGIFSVNSAGAWTYTLNNNAAAVQNLGDNSHPTDTFTVTSSDGTATQTVTITVNGTNDAPAGIDKAITAVEDSAYTFATTDFGFTDKEGNALLGVKITTLPVNGILTLNGLAVAVDQTVTASDLANGLLQFTPNANGSGNNYANFKFAVQDTGGTAHGGVDTDQVSNTITLNVTGVNDAPAGTDKTITTSEDATYAFKAADFGFTDTDGGTLAGVKITQLPGAGTLTLNGVAVNADQVISFSNIIGGFLKFTPAPNANGDGYAALQFAVQDTGGTANGGVDFDQSPNTITLNVTGVNDAPAGVGKTITTLEDTAYTFATSDFGFTDPDGNALLGVKIATLPNSGSLTLNGTAVGLNQIVSASDIANGLLKFTPAADSTIGTSFRFAVQDDGGTTNGGIDIDPSQRTIMVAVTPVNDAPVLDPSKSPAMTVNEDAAVPSGTEAGVVVSTLSDRAIDGVGPDNVTDLESTLTGMAIVGVNTSLGTLYYSPNGGTNWIAVGAVSEANALLLNSNFKLYFKPIANYSGTIADAITFRSWDQSAGTGTTYVNTTTNGGSTAYSVATDTISVTVNSVNDTPLAQTKAVAVSEDGALTAQTVTATDPDGDALTYAIVGDTPAGLTFNTADGTWSYTPPAVHQGLDDTEKATVTFQYKVNDGTVDSTPATVTITINGANDKPVAQAGSASVSEDGSLTGQAVTATDVDGGNLTYAIVGNTPPGLIFNPTNGTWSYTPPAGYQSLDSTESAEVTFQYKANDGTVDSEPATVTITINGANDAPIAMNRSATVSEDGTLNGPAAAATDIDGETLTYAVVGTPPDGLTFNTDGTWSYMPPASFQSLDTNEPRQVVFQYTASDGTATSNAGTITITVQGANDAPVGQDGVATVSEDGVLAGQAVTATDVDGEGLTYAVFGPKPAGLTFNADGTWTYTPPASYQSLAAGQQDQVTFQYKANDGTVDSALATVTITIQGANEVLSAQDSAASVSEDGTLTGQHVSASDGSGTPLTYSVVNGLPEGVTFNNDGTWSYAPPASYQSLDSGEPATVSFQYKANNGIEDSNTATVIITINGANDAPVAQDRSASVTEDGALTAQTVTATDIDGENLIFSLVGAPTQGLTFNTDGTWTYAPPVAMFQALDDNETATVSFQYKANDGTVDSQPATVTITIMGANDAPVAQSGSVDVSEDGALTGKAVVATDIDGDTLTYALAGPALAGLTFNTDGSWSYTPLSSYQSLAAGQSQSVSFQYNAFDGTSYSNTATQTIVVQGADDAPTARTDFGSMTEDTGTAIFNVLANDTLDPDSGAPNTISIGNIVITGGESYGITAADLLVTVTSDNQIQVKLQGTDWNSIWNGGFFDVSVNYTLNGDQSTSGNVLSIRMNGLNDAPVLNAAASPTIAAGEDAPTPVNGTAGTAVSTMIDRVIDGNGPDNMVDADSFLAGIAIVGQNTSQGTWYYSVTGGATWSVVSAVSTANALVLRPEHLLYFKPNANYSGTIEDALTIRAWDGSGGSPGGYNNTTVNGGTSPFSTATDTISLTVTGVNDPAVISGDKSGGVTEDAVQNKATGDLYSTDVDGTADAWQAVTNATQTANNYGTYTIDATGHWVYTLNNSNPTVNDLAAGETLIDIFTARTADGTTQVVTVTITGASDAPVGINLDDITLGTGGFKIIGENANDLAGASVASVGDVNGDGYDDLIVGANQNSAGELRAGAAYVVYGNATRFTTTINLDDIAAGTGGFRIAGQNSGDQAGVSVASAGDFNGDGYDDLIIGASRNDQGGNDAGAAYVVYGQSTAIPSIDLDHVPLEIRSFKISGQGGGVGISVASGGDIDGDGFDDLLVAAPNVFIDDQKFGAAYVIYGTASAITSIDLDTVTTGSRGFKIIGIADNGQFGSRVASAGDVNGDGYDDLIVGAFGDGQGGTNAGAAYVVFGQAQRFTTIDLNSIANGTGGFKIIGEISNQYVGFSVASAGDINGDSYDDLIIGENDDSGTLAGAAYVIYGKATQFTSIDLDNIAADHGGFRITGEHSFDRAGTSVASAGDVNGDGYADLIVSTSAEDAGGTNAGAAYVVYGKAAPFASFNLADIAAGHGGFKIIGENASDNAGSSAASAGDINHDGYDDIIVGAIGNDNIGGSNAGAAYVIYGGQDLPNNTSAHIAGADTGTVKEDVTATASGTLTVTLANQSAGTFTAATTSGTYGSFSLLANGTWTYTLNNANIAVQALDNGDHLTDNFKVKSADGTAIDTVTVTINGTDDPIKLADIALGHGGFKIIGQATNTVAGTSIASAGDINGDGFDDLIIGAPNVNPNTGPGAAYVIYGAAAMTSPINLSAVAADHGGFMIIGQNSSDHAGISVASAGDINGDSYDDLIIGANQNDAGGPDAGAAYVIYGSATKLASIDLNNMAASAGFKIIVDTAGKLGGGSVASAGDINGDGYDDLIVGTYLNGGGRGAAYVIYGKTGPMGPIDLNSIPAGTGFKIVGENALDLAGSSVASAGDINGDGYDDLIIGAHNNQAGAEYAGAAYVVYGKAAAITSQINLSAIAAGSGGFKIIGASAFDFAGTSVASAGDVNGDGYDDLIVGAQNSQAGGGNAGAAYVVYGAATGTSVDLENIATNQGFKIIGIAGDRVGASVASAGDINGDGYKDLIIGASSGDGETVNVGAAYVVYGKSGPFTAINVNDIAAGHGGFKIVGENRDDFAGQSVASAGDVNGDGYDDLFVGAAYNSAGAPNAGAAYVIYGGAELGGQNGLNLVGTAGADTLTGKAGDDVLFGGAGADILTGGLGADIFKYTAASQGGDTIKDFNMSEDTIGIFRDLLGVSATGALEADGTAVGSSTVLFESVGSATAAAQHNSTKLIFDTANHDLYYDSDGGASASGRILLAHFDNMNALEASSIMLTG